MVVTVLLAQARPADCQCLCTGHTMGMASLEGEPTDQALLGDNAASGSSFPIASARTAPLVIRRGMDTFRIEIGVVDDAGVTSITLNNALANGPLRQNGSTPASIVFRDDGTQGDSVSGDFIFTAEGILPPAFGDDPTGVWLVLNNEWTVTFADDTSVTIVDGFDLALRYIDASIVPTPTVEQLDSNVFRTDNVVHVIQAYDGTFPDYTYSRQETAQIYYSHFPDNRDFLFMNAPINDGGGNGVYWGVRNDAEGFGISYFDLSSVFGSNGVLQGVVQIKGAAVNFGLITHELLHRWANRMPASTDLAPNPTFPFHWQQIQRPASGFGAGGQNGVFENLQSTKDGRYATWTPLDLDGYPVTFENKYSDLELYIMGLVGPEDVAEPINTLVDPVVDRVEFTGLGNVTIYYQASGIRGLTMQEIVDAAGPRVPAVGVAQHHFRFGMIVVHDRQLTATELAWFDYPIDMYDEAASPYRPPTFIEATSGLATASSGIPRVNDCDGDHVLDIDEINAGAPDCNDNGIPDECESLADCDLDGILDICDLVDNDCNQNAIPDLCENDADCQGDGILDICQVTSNDCNSNSIPDECESADDCNDDGVQDICQLDNNDCNGDNVPDDCQLQENDCNANGEPDECELFPVCIPPGGCYFPDDCNLNGVLDECDVAVQDCNSNGIPDECDIGIVPGNDCCNVQFGSGCNDPVIQDCVCEIMPTCCFINWSRACVDLVASSGCGECIVPPEVADCNHNDTPDGCDIAARESLDTDGNGVPDECQRAVPAVTEWGVAVLALMTLTVGTLMFGRK